MRKDESENPIYIHHRFNDVAWLYHANCRLLVILRHFTVPVDALLVGAQDGVVLLVRTPCELLQHCFLGIAEELVRPRVCVLRPPLDDFLLILVGTLHEGRLIVLGACGRIGGGSLLSLLFLTVFLGLLLFTHSTT